MNRFTVITIDGPAGAGKSTVARKVAAALGFSYLDTGALYRALTLHLIEKNVKPEDCSASGAILQAAEIRIQENRVFLGPREVTEQIRSRQVDAEVSAYSGVPEVRDRLLGLQREQSNRGNLVADGRDMGSVVFSDADYKFFLEAGVDVRAQRRWKELIQKGEDVSYEKVKDNVMHRDAADSARDIAPLVVPQGCHIIDTSLLTIDEVTEQILGVVAADK